MKFFTLDDVDCHGKRVLLRTGFDVPVDDQGHIVDDRRIKIAIPTIEYILKQNPKQLVIFFHMGRPKDREPALQTNRVAERLSELIARHVKKIDDHGENGVPDPNENQIVMLENLRFNSGEKDKDQKKRDEFGKHLASLGDVFVQDGFSNCHHDHASMTSVPKFVKSCAGRSVENEIKVLSVALENPQRPFVSIIGGLKAEKLNVVEHLLPKVDKVLVGGALAFTILKGLGYEVGNTKIDSEGLKSFKDLVEKIRNEEKVVLPVDARVADRFAADADMKVVRVEKIDPGWMALDIGPETVKLFKAYIMDAKTVTWNGPVGVFEYDKFAAGTKELAEATSKVDGMTIIGGGESAEAIEKLGYADKVTHISSGGGASLMLLEGKELPAITALEQSCEKYR